MKKFASKGFTLVELLVSMVILGVLITVVLSSISGSGVQAKSQALNMYDASAKVVSNWTAVSQYMGTSGNPDSSNLLRAAAHTALDVVIPLDPTPALATQYVARFQQSSPIRPISSIQVIQVPTASAAGVYAIGNVQNTITLSYNSATREMLFNVANVDADVVKELVESKEGSSTGVTYTGAAKTTGMIRYTAVSATDTHTLTIASRL